MAHTKIAKDKRLDTAGSKKPSSYLVIAARGLALFFGVFALLNAIACIRGNSVNQNIWWVDASFINSYVNVAIQTITAVLLILYALRPRAGKIRRYATSVSMLCICLVAFQNAFAYWEALSLGSLFAGAPIPFSLLIAVLFLFLALTVAACTPRKSTSRYGRLCITAIVAVCIIGFPLLQIVTFGASDYRRNADAVIVLGARVNPDGSLSMSLQERVDGAIELYEEGYVATVIMSGGTGAEGVNEAEAMKKYAVAHGVPAKRILVDSNGVTTEATATNTLAIASEHGYNRLLVTSSFYHMPRIKMMYLAANTDVYTVPVSGNWLDDGTFIALPREIPGWWVYWVKNAILV